MDKTQIINEIYKYKKFNSKTEFANFLGISPQSLNFWFTKGAYDINVIFKKIPELNPAWLISGEGEMLISDVSVMGCKTGKILPVNLLNLKTSIDEYISENELFDCCPSELIPKFSLAYQIQTRMLEPYLYRHDWILIKKIPMSDVVLGNLYLIDTKKFGKMIKIVDMIDNTSTFTLSLPFNNKYPILQVHSEDIFDFYEILTQIKLSKPDIENNSVMNTELIQQNNEFLNLANTALKNQEKTLEILSNAIEIIKNGKGV